MKAEPVKLSPLRRGELSARELCIGCPKRMAMEVNTYPVWEPVRASGR